MGKVDRSFLRHRAARIQDEAGGLCARVLANPAETQALSEAEFDRRAADILARWDANQVALAAAEHEEAQPMAQPVYTPEEVAGHLKVTAAKVRDWLRTGYLKGFKLGPKEWRVAEQDLEAFIERLRASDADVT